MAATSKTLTIATSANASCALKKGEGDDGEQPKLKIVKRMGLTSPKYLDEVLHYFLRRQREKALNPPTFK